MKQIRFFTFLQGIAVGETMMFAWYGMMFEMVLMGTVALLLNAGINYMKNESEKKDTSMGPE